MNFDQIISSLEKKQYKPVYFLTGEQAYYIDEISNYIENNVLDESEKDFNQTIVYGRDTNEHTIISSAKRFPMMAQYQVLIVKEAQDLKHIEELESYIKSPLDSTILVLCYKYKKIDKRKAFYKAVSKYGEFFESEVVREYQVPAWIAGYLKKKQYTIGPRECALLSDHLGNNLSKIVNELEKLSINVPVGSTITAHHIEENIGISKDYNIFELQDALGQKKIEKATRIINYFASNTKDYPVPMVTAILFTYFMKVGIFHEIVDKSKNNVASTLGINPFFVKDFEKAAQYYSRKSVARVISLLREYDLKSKGVDNASTSQGELLRELIYKILHVG